MFLITLILLILFHGDQILTEQIDRFTDPFLIIRLGLLPIGRGRMVWLSFSSTLRTLLDSL